MSETDGHLPPSAFSAGPLAALPGASSVVASWCDVAAHLHEEQVSPGTGRGDGAHWEPLVKVGSAPGARQGRGEPGRRRAGVSSWWGLSFKDPTPGRA